ncbi:MAG: glycosyltransferase, partial [Methyloprofundus sp.]|nr:glycosyltransferase [Methyloprofundus sp.]
MPNKNQLKLYKVEQLLVVHWRMEVPLSGALDFLLNGESLPKPFLAVQMTSPLEMFIIVDARTHKLTARKNSLSILSQETEQVLSKVEQGTITLLPKKLLLSYNKPVQARFFTRLLQHTRQRFNDLDDELIHALIKRYAYPVKELYQISDELLFIRLPWEIERDSNILPLIFCYVSEQGVFEQQKQLGLWQDGALHLFVKASSVDKLYGILSHSKSVSIPLSFAQAEKITREELLEKLSQESTAEATLASFLMPKFEKNTADVKNISTKIADFKAHVLGVKQQRIIGWAKNSANLSRPVRVDLYENKQKISSVLADQDCQQLGYTEPLGECGFSMPIADECLQGELRQMELIYSETGELLPEGRVKLGDGEFDCKLLIEQGARVKASFQQRTLTNAIFSVQLLLDDELFYSMEYIGRQAFELIEKLPAQVFDNQLHTLQLNIINPANELLYSAIGKIQHKHHGVLEQVDYKKIKGCVFNQSYPDLPATIDIVINDEHTMTTVCDQSRIDIQKKYSLSSGRVGFEVDVPDRFIIEPCVKVALYFHNTKALVVPRHTILTPKDLIIRSLVRAAEFLKSSEGDDSDWLKAGIDANAWTRSQVIEPAIKALRQKAGMPQQVQLKIAPKITQPKVNKSAIVDVIIPVYQGYEETVQCIESVLTAKVTVAFQLIVLNDYSPDGRLKYKLQAMAQAQGFSLVENSENLGFVGTVNKGMRVHPDRDVVLLNSDTVVADGWLDRLLVASQQNQNIATVTPFSNNATICSFPLFNQDNDLPSGVSLAQLNGLFCQYNQGKIIDLPTAVGFCMLIKREALLDIGYFDEQKWQQGYGEENDFCLRAANLGWRHVLACDVFVQHHGSVSFADTKQARITQNLALLEQIYPDYEVMIQRFIKQDPIALQRNRVLKALLLEKKSSQFFLFVMHGLGGGAKAHGEHLAQLLEAQQQAVLELSVITPGKWQLQSPRFGYTLIYHYPEDYGQLVDDLSELGISRVHYHQVLGFPKKIWQLAEQLGCSYDFTAHDFMPICPRINMIDETGAFCAESQFDVEKCQRCIALNGVTNSEVELHLEAFGGSVEKWRIFYAIVLAKAKHIFCPSNSTAAIYRQHLSLSSIKVMPHPEESFTILPVPALAEEGVLSVAVIGAIGDHKGYRLLLDCAKNALKEGFPLRFIVAGYTRDDESLAKLANVTITGAYQNAAQLAGFLQRYDCRVAAFLSVWPETFCYTLTEALQNNLYPVTLDYGAVAERLQ